MLVPVLKQIVLRGEPNSNDNFVLAANADIGTIGADGVEYFYFRIMTPKKMAEIVAEDGIVDGRATFVINHFDLGLVENEINKILQDCIRPTWEEVAHAINRYLNWEYDNINYSPLKSLTKN